MDAYVDAEGKRDMKYYRIATRSDVESIWRWRSTVLVTRWTVFQFLQPYQTLPQDRLRVFTASSRENLDVQLARENQGLETDSLTAAQFLHPQLSSSQEVPQAHSPQRAVSDTTDSPASLSLWLPERWRLVPLQLVDFVLDAELLTLQIVDCILIGERTLDFFIESAFERGMLLLERLDAILQRHA